MKGKILKTMRFATYFINLRSLLTKTARIKTIFLMKNGATLLIELYESARGQSTSFSIRAFVTI